MISVIISIEGSPKKIWGGEYVTRIKKKVDRCYAQPITFSSCACRLVSDPRRPDKNRSILHRIVVAITIVMTECL